MEESNRCRAAVAGAALLACTLLAASAAQAKNDETVIVNTPVNPVPVMPVVPATQFSPAPVALSLSLQGMFVDPDPSGTRYAITSVTVSNPTAVSYTVIVKAVAVAIAPSCRSAANQQAFADGPVVTVSPNSTAHVTFPIPFVTAPVSGTFVCLVAAGTNAPVGATWSAVGYRLLP